MSQILQIIVGKKLFEFSSEGDWVRHAKHRFAHAPVRASRTVCVDSAGHICVQGLDFMAATFGGWYPIGVYAISDDPEKGVA